ncbi:hypothetical protein FRC01_000627 [Tulasnella sp. 417]|nr:hypothetical protein FRC01_000627 [Tulasnella sp. 417]
MQPQPQPETEAEDFLKRWFKEFTKAPGNEPAMAKHVGDLWFRFIWNNDRKESIILEFRDWEGPRAGKIALCPTANAKVLAIAEGLVGAASLSPEGEETMSCVCGCTKKEK